VIYADLVQLRGFNLSDEVFQILVSTAESEIGKRREDKGGRVYLIA